MTQCRLTKYGIILLAICSISLTSCGSDDSVDAFQFTDPIQQVDDQPPVVTSTGESTTGESTTGESTTGESTTGESTTGESTTGGSIETISGLPLQGNFSYVPTTDVFERNTPRWMDYFETQMVAALEPFNLLEGLLEETVPIYYDGCGASNATYNVLTNSITLCDELVDSAIEHFNGDYDAAISAISFVVYHEIAHALVEIRNVPFVGNLESVADSLAAVVSGRSGRAMGSVYAALFLLSADVSYADEHIGGEDRAGDIVCLAIGSDSRLLSNPELTDLISQFNEVGRDCVSEYETRRNSVAILLPPLNAIEESALTLPSVVAASDPNPPKFEGEPDDGSSGNISFGIDSLVNSSDFWLCARTDGTSVSYQFREDLTGTYVFEDENSTSEDGLTPLAFSYTLTGSESVELLYEFSNGNSFIESISEISFSNSTAFSGNSNSDGQLVCQKQEITNQSATIRAFLHSASISPFNIR